MPKGMDWYPINTDDLPKSEKEAFRAAERAYSEWEAKKKVLFDMLQPIAYKISMPDGTKLIPDGMMPSFSYTGTALLVAPREVGKVRTNGKPKLSFK